MSDPKTVSIKALRHFADGGSPFGDGPPLLTVDADYFKGLIDRLEAAEKERSNYEYDLLHGEHMRLRDGIRALADETPHKTTDHLGNVTGYLIGADDLRALLDREEAQ